MPEIQPFENKGHIVLITPPFFGHIFPLLDFAEQLSKQHHVTYVVSASKLDALKDRGMLIEDGDNKLISSNSQINFIGLFDHNDDTYEISSI